MVPELRESLAGVELPESSISNMTIEKISETKDTAEVTAEYDLQLTFEGKLQEAHLKVKFSLEKRDGVWLVSGQEPIALEQESVQVLVHDEAGTPIVGAEVLIYVVETETKRTGTTNAEGVAIFKNVGEPDIIQVTMEGYTSSRGYRFKLGEGYKVQLECLAGGPGDGA